ncbi:MAG: hypothetical protein PHC30_01095, partial [Lentisphaeria bacterium]|nr:hypothetical protein [Lentisphaeria bacterium]
EALMALVALQPHVPSEQTGRWMELLAGIDPERCYFSCRPENGGGAGHNFVTFAIAAEAGRQMLGLAPRSDFLDRMVGLQLRHLDNHGMYRDPKCPMTYDAVARMNLALARSFGYDGAWAGQLDAGLTRGAMAQLLYQSPTGVMPFGGRSNQQNFNEVTFAVLCEYEAARCAAAAPVLAGAFRRAAALAFAAIQPYLADKTVFFTKNFFPPDAEVIHGREKGYGWYSPYCLLIASQLGFAARLAGDAVPTAAAAPAEYGTYFWPTTEAFHKIFAGCHGLQVEIERHADPDYDATGLGRIQRRNCPVLLGLSAPAPAAPRFFTCVPPGLDTAIGPEVDGVTLAAQHGPRLTSRIRDAAVSRDQVAFSIDYAAEGLAVTEHYRLTAEGLDLVVEAGGAGAFVFRVPVLETDGRQQGRLALTMSGFDFQFLGGVYQVREVSGQASVQLEDAPAVNRNGIYRVVRFELPSRRAAFRLLMKPAVTG